MTPSPDLDPPAPDTEEPPRLRTSRLRFRPPAADDPTPLQSPDPSLETASDGSAGPSSADAPPRSDGPLEPPSTPSGSSRTSSRADRKAIEQTTVQVVQGASVTAHQFLCRDEAERQVGLYLTDSQDEVGIAGPVGGLLSRRGVADGLAGNTDLADLIGLGMALGFYLVKQLRRMMEAKALRSATEPAPGFEGAAGSDDPGPL